MLESFLTESPFGIHRPCSKEKSLQWFMRCSLSFMGALPWIPMNHGNLPWIMGSIRIHGKLQYFLGKSHSESSHDSWELPMDYGRLPWIVGGSHESCELSLCDFPLNYRSFPWITGASHESWEAPMNHGRLPWFMGGSHDSWEFMGEFPWMGEPLMNHGRLASGERRR